MTPDDARALGAQALFGEKYGDEVRVVSMGREDGSGRGSTKDTYSIELCGGTHVRRTGDIGSFKLVSESATANGVRRIEALTGRGAVRFLNAQEHALSAAASIVKARPEELAGRIRALLDERKKLQVEIADLRRQVALAGNSKDGREAEVKKVNGIPFVAQILRDVNGKDLRGLIDAHKSRLGSGVIVLIADVGGKAAIASGVTDDLTGKISAVDVVRAVVARLGGKGGGGRADMAQAGGPDIKNAAAAIADAEQLLEDL